MPVKVNISKSQVKTRIETAWKAALPILSEEILNDCNEYCKEREGTLIASSLTHSRPQDGLLIWRTPYARRQYWLITAHKDKNPSASWKWCEVAKRRHVKKWQGLAQRALKEKL